MKSSYPTLNSVKAVVLIFVFLFVGYNFLNCIYSKSKIVFLSGLWPRTIKIVTIIFYSFDLQQKKDISTNLLKGPTWEWTNAICCSYFFLLIITDTFIKQIQQEKYVDKHLSTTYKQVDKNLFYNAIKQIISTS